MSIYIVHHHKKNNASNVLDVPSTVQKETSSLYDENSQFAWTRRLLLSRYKIVLEQEQLSLLLEYISM